MRCIPESSLGPSWSYMVPPWANMWPSWANVGPYWHNMGPSKPIWGNPKAILGTIFGQHVAILGQHGAILAQHRASVGQSWGQVQKRWVFPCFLNVFLTIIVSKCQKHCIFPGFRTSQNKKHRFSSVFCTFLYRQICLRRGKPRGPADRRGPP